MQRTAHDLICIAFSLGKSYFKLERNVVAQFQKLFHFPLNEICGTVLMAQR